MTPLPSAPPALRQALAWQSDVLSRNQVLLAGLDDNDLRRLLRRRELVRLHPGVYVAHTGPPTWLQRAWAAVLYAEPAALCHASALRAECGPGRQTGDGPIHLAIDRTRSLRARPGVVVHRLADLEAKARWNVGPPRLRVEHAALDVAAEAPGDLDAVATLADVVQARRTTASRLLAVLASRSRIARRPLLESVLRDVAAGACSTLEREYLTAVERAHGLPAAQRQVRDSRKGTVYRDVEYPRYGLVVELDGRLFHERVLDRDRDLERDLDAAAAGRDTVRLGWGQVHHRPCRTAAKLAGLLQARGWGDSLVPCPSCPPAHGQRLLAVTR